MVNINGAGNSYQPKNAVEKEMKQMGNHLIDGSFSSKSIGKYSKGVPYNSKTNYVSANSAQKQAGRAKQDYIYKDGIFDKNEMTDFATHFGSRSKEYPALQKASKQDIQKAANNIGEMRDEKRLKTIEEVKVRNAQADDTSRYQEAEPETKQKPKHSTDISFMDVINGKHSLKEYAFGQTDEQNQAMKAEMMDAKVNGTFKPGEAQKRMNKLTD